MPALLPGSDDEESLTPDRSLVRVEHGDPNQCQANHSHIQCPYRAIGTRKPNGDWDGPQYCPRHGAGTAKALQRKDTRLYDLAKWQDKMTRISGNAQLKNLRDDVAILRMTLENKFRQITDEAELEMRSSSIAELVREIAKTVQVAHKIERDSGELLDKVQALIWVKDVVDIISSRITDQETLKSIGEEILLSLDKLFPKS